MRDFKFGGTLFLVALLAIGCLALVSCGSGSGSGSGVVSGTSGSTGSVAILLTDKPAEFSGVLVKITKIELLSDHSRVTIPVTEPEIDLLSLKNEAMLLEIGESVPVGWYNKIRLTVTDVCVTENSMGNCEKVKLPANGKIDLNPKVPFYVAPGEMLTIQLDIDAKKSIHLHETGSEKYILRPVVFITVIDGVPPEKLLRIHGYVGTIYGDGFTVCPEQALRNGDGDFCTRVYVTGGETSFFSSRESGGPVAFGDLTAGNKVTVVGLMRMKTEITHYEDGDDRSWLGIDAIVVEIGGFLEKIRVTAQLPVDASNQFPFEPMESSGIGGPGQVQIQEGTKIYSPQGDPLDASSISRGTVAELDGFLILSPDSDVINAAFILIDTAVEPETALSGVIAEGSIDEALFAFDLIVEGASEPVCVNATNNTQVYVAQESGPAYTFTEGEFGDLLDGMEVDVYGAEGGGCFVAETIIAYQLSGNGT